MYDQYFFYSYKKTENVKDGQQQGWGMLKAMLHISKYMCVAYVLFYFFYFYHFFYILIFIKAIYKYTMVGCQKWYK